MSGQCAENRESSNSNCGNGACEAGENSQNCQQDCSAVTCNDGIKNRGESDVDCGAVCLKCADDRTCFTEGDCLGRSCVNGICRSPKVIQEKVTCVFKGAMGEVSCNSLNGPASGCSGTGSCTALIREMYTTMPEEKIKWESDCGTTHFIQSKVYITLDGIDETVILDCSQTRSGNPNPNPIPQACTGCLKDDTCLPFGTRVLEGNDAKYCDITKQFAVQKSQDG